MGLISFLIFHISVDKHDSVVNIEITRIEKRSSVTRDRNETSIHIDGE